MAAPQSESLIPATPGRRAYEALTPNEQGILQLLSIYYEPITRTNLLPMITELGIRHTPSRAYSGALLDPVLKQLAAEKWLVAAERNLRCNPWLAHSLTMQSIREQRFQLYVNLLRDKRFATPTWYGFRFHSYLHGLRELRLLFYQKFFERVPEYMEALANSYMDEFLRDPPLVALCGRPFDEVWFADLPMQIQLSALSSILNHSLDTLQAPDAALRYAERLYRDKVPIPAFAVLIAEQQGFRGRLEEAERLVAELPGPAPEVVLAWLRFLRGDRDEALERYGSALRQVEKESRKKKKPFFQSRPGVFHLLALIERGDGVAIQEAENYLERAVSDRNHPIPEVFEKLVPVLEVVHAGAAEKPPAVRFSGAWAIPGVLQENALADLIDALSQYWINATLTHHPREALEKVVERAEQSGYRWIAAETAELLSRLEPRSEAYAARAAMLRQQGGFRTLVDLVRPKAAWERALEALTRVTAPPPPPAAAVANAPEERRLVWLLSWHNNRLIEIQPKEQKRDARGGWSRGRNVALRRLSEGADDLEHLSPEDRALVATIRSDHYRRFGYVNEEFSFDFTKALPALIGHPRVFWSDAPDVRVEVVRGEPQLVISEGTKFFKVDLSPFPEEGDEVAALREGPDRLKVVSFNAGHRRIATIVGADGLKLPKHAKDRVREVIGSLSSVVTIQSDIAGVGGQLEEIAGDPTPWVRLVPSGRGLKLELLVRPFGEKGPHFRAGAGGARVIAEVDGRRLQARRNLPTERTRAEEVVSACPPLEQRDDEEGVWSLEEPEAALETLLALRQLGDRVRIEWPQGETFKVAGEASFEQLHLRIKRDEDWFSASGEVSIPDGEVLDMARLIELLDTGPGRFIPLGEDRFLALTAEMRRRLEALRAYGTRRGKGIQLTPLAAQAMEELTEGLGGLEVDKHWQGQIGRMREAWALEAEVPSTLRAELREYQLEGFRWLARLAHWGVGACLADDMGLGKTVQTLALLLRRAPEGPALVVAPTSVCPNWVSEAQRFAPTLEVQLFGTGDRKAALEGLGPFGLLVCSYGLLHQEIELLEKVRWRTVVLDEAQAIKNVATRRSQAAQRLQADFRMVTTGTPIENHLGELWNLFRFLNPGLLGSLEHFNDRFAIPIEKLHNREARTRLRRLLQPFILRRSKSEVLTELPARTEILLRVELSGEEAALYEAVRRRAIEHLSGIEVPPGGRKLMILAEIMKLRRVACNPRLVMPDLSIQGAKLSELDGIVDELLENRHKALIFSQFVDHLGILREHLEARGVKLQYLDGSTPMAERKRRVEAFQAGDGDVFLISLKAGGTGLNLTAADYVIHMDPWWNPAVEDQASDRAHRIGQSRPVTIYRLVAKGTIEEKMVALHHQKRDLADSLLEGTDVGGRLTEEELMALLREG